MNDATNLTDLVLISLFAFSIWLFNYLTDKKDRPEEVPKEPPRGGKKFLWRFRAGEEKMEMKIWRVRDSV